jgi:hypothetical protein
VTLVQLASQAGWGVDSENVERAEKPTISLKAGLGEEASEEENVEESETENEPEENDWDE